MKIFDLQCTNGHTFEGWFSSEDDFQDQLTRELLSCPMCSASDVAKLPSAPRLNLRRSSRRRRTVQAENDTARPAAVASVQAETLQAAWLEAVRHVMEKTEDVGRRFAEEARRIHYGEAEARGIRGQATREETRELLDEGVPVMPLPVPDSMKDTLQ